ncbi:sugar dehydrogenase [Nonomuraea terrae]|uniref:Sugar dehydrogenase n=1 Tax=Nonomuraea terrae TaxID=2530383 RepID=A0A4R4YKJ0_9ACTN|nr:PQQ-dependent sugar dehydrogenase [Nonomuraea terrae]TDD44559.1 sugar dehydrogenase [Nonomuraea terrae]
MTGVRLTAAVLLLVALTACSPDRPSAASASPAPSASAAATPTGSAPPERGRLRFREIARLEQPVAFAVREGDDRLYVAEQTGRLRTSEGDTVIDLSGEVSTGNEQGLLGVAFHPTGRWVYLDWTDAQGHTHVTEWAYDGTRATARRDVLTQEQPYANHNGGQLAFGPDGHLYIALGDGGSAGDPQGNAQDLGTLLGKILRIDPRGEPYEIPEDNPFVGREGARPEIWAYGLRNPWRFTFDRESGDLWIGDVGQNAWEEVNRQPAGSEGGENYGWNLREGERPYRGGEGRDLVDPVITYPLGEGGNCSVIAGPVYRGRQIPWLRGHFLYGDFCAGWIRAAPVDDIADAAEAGEVEQLSSFGEGPDGEIYALSLQGPLYRIEPA